MSNVEYRASQFLKDATPQHIQALFDLLKVHVAEDVLAAARRKVLGYYPDDKNPRFLEAMVRWYSRQVADTIWYQAVQQAKHAEVK